MLDNESLFTNVPIKETIDIVIQNVYRHSLLQIRLTIPCKYLSCMKHFYDHYIDSIAMGSPLGSTISNFYIRHIEDKILSFTKSLISVPDINQVKYSY